MGRVKRHNECGLVVGQLGFHNTAPPRRHPEGPRFQSLLRNPTNIHRWARLQLEPECCMHQARASFAISVAAPSTCNMRFRL